MILEFGICWEAFDLYDELLVPTQMRNAGNSKGDFVVVPGEHDWETQKTTVRKINNTNISPPQYRAYLMV